MNTLYNDRPEIEKDFIREVCSSIIDSPIEKKGESNDFAGIFIEGRDREACLEDFAALSSFKRFSKYDYPLYVYSSNPQKFVSSFKTRIPGRIWFLKINEIKSLEDYTKFCINELYFTLPPEIENVITLQPDGMLLKNGWEDYIKNSGVDWLSPHWKHYARIEMLRNDNKWIIPYSTPTPIGNGGFSFRKASKIRKICRYNVLKLREFGREDDRIPMEDLFFTYLGLNMGILKMPTLKQCDEFAVDPLTLDIWNDKANLPFGFHYFRTESEFPPCNHD